VTLTNGQTLTALALLNRPTDRLFLRTNGPGYASTYKAFILTATRRFANRYQLTAGYTRQRAEGLDLSSGTAGQDPNDLINARGGLGSRDRPRRLELAGEIKNALQEQGGPDIPTTVFNAPNFLQMNLIPEPRQLRLFARWFF